MRGWCQGRGSVASMPIRIESAHSLGARVGVFAGKPAFTVLVGAVRLESQVGGGGIMATGDASDPWVLRTAPGTSEYTMYRDGDDLVCQVGSTRLTYHARAVEDLHQWLLAQGDWVPLGAADEQKPAADGTVEAWGRSESNPVGGWYGTRKGYRGRFGMYLPPLLEELGMAELEHNARNNRVRAIPWR